MVESIYEIEVLLNDPKRKLFSAVLYGRIFVNQIEVCKIPLEIDAIADSMYEATIDYEPFIKNWELQRITASQAYFNQLIRFYENVEILKNKTIKQIGTNDSK